MYELPQIHYFQATNQNQISHIIKNNTIQFQS
jgi:hypothetical protein